MPRWRRATWIVLFNIAFWVLLLCWWLVGVLWAMPPNERNAVDGAVAELVLGVGVTIALVMVAVTLFYWARTRRRDSGRASLERRSSSPD